MLDERFYCVGDFWNAPDRWEGIADPHKEMFWMKRRRDVIDVRKAHALHPAQNAWNPNSLAGLLQNPYPSQLAMHQQFMLNGPYAGQRPSLGILGALGLM